MSLDNWDNNPIIDYDGETKTDFSQIPKDEELDKIKAACDKFYNEHIACLTSVISKERFWVIYRDLASHDLNDNIKKGTIIDPAINSQNAIKFADCYRGSRYIIMNHANLDNENILTEFIYNAMYMKFLNADTIEKLYEAQEYAACLHDKYVAAIWYDFTCLKHAEPLHITIHVDFVDSKDGKEISVTHNILCDTCNLYIAGQMMYIDAINSYNMAAEAVVSKIWQVYENHIWSKDWNPTVDDFKEEEDDDYDPWGWDDYDAEEELRREDYYDKHQ